MVNLGKVGLVAEIPLRDKGSGDAIGTGFVERTKSGYVIVHIDLSQLPERSVYDGFAIDPIEVKESSDGAV